MSADCPFVLSAGHVNWDVTLRVDALPDPDGEAAIRSQHRSGGGSAANVACALAGLEVDAGLIGSVGEDDVAGYVRRELDAAGVDCRNLISVGDGETAIKYLIVAEDGQVLVFGNDGVNEAFGPGDVDADYLRSADHLHLTSQAPETAAYLAETASAAGVPVSFDPGRRLADRDYSHALAHADVVFLNDREAGAILDDDLEHPSAELHGRVVVTKHGPRGGAVHTPERTFEHPGFEVEPVDTTGAGDAFAAGFVATLLEHDDYERALEFANACGALASQSEGARTAPTRKEIEAFLDGQFG
jgi:ribokinase